MQVTAMFQSTLSPAASSSLLVMGAGLQPGLSELSVRYGARGRHRCCTDADEEREGKTSACWIQPARRKATI